MISNLTVNGLPELGGKCAEEIEIVSSENCVLGHVDHTHAAFAKFFDNAIVRNSRPDHSIRSSIKDEKLLGNCYKIAGYTKSRPSSKLSERIVTLLRTYFQAMVRFEL